MWSLLNRFVPLGVIARWWYVLLAGPAVGLLLALGSRTIGGTNEYPKVGSACCWAGFNATRGYMC